ncbi:MULTISPECIES: nickel transporter permease [Brevibacillus]|jgi:peptide/nickel transport system permease protein|uniref:nickel transporter permease n=1 Tax=Brevibacillus TaxID=55080 RepID=UPI000E365661|nr:MULTISPECIES: nickel transporter permease [Brevibacillus]MBR8659319.1 ABC transporter permease [Brevibacillus sp. NL20B1]MDT3414521.1 peptide/nickel transport system permease protein [Brevibacillus aydinogluensis]NNV02472.1 ABC transporter permease [Brevibacillus sp. MCWH]REK64635.1 MAG: peptide ABC transporter permease [Brevibacillus sp.]
MAETHVETVRVQQTDEPVSSPWRDAWRTLRKNKLAIVGFIIIFVFVLLALLAPYITPYEYDKGELINKNKPPSAEHWFGTDYNGRDVFTRVIYGAQISLRVGLFSVIGSVIVGTFLGLLAGYYGRWVDMIISRLFDIMLAFPSILLAIAIVAMLGPSLENALLAIAIVNIPTYGRLVRSRVLSLKEEEFVMAAKAIGSKNSRIILHHILPNSLAPIIVTGTLGIATAILEAAALGFLGLGAQPPQPEWGLMLSDSRQYIQKAPWTVIFPGLSIMLTVLGFNLIGDGLRDALDPRMKH